LRATKEAIDLVVENPMMRRDLFKMAGAFSVMAADAGAQGSGGTFRRVRPGDAGWPAQAQWQALNDRVGGQLTAVRHGRCDAIGAMQNTAPGR